MESGRPARDAGYFDQWYADMGVSPARDAIVAHALGLPPELQSTSLLTWQGIAEVTEALRMPPGGLLADVACGRGGYGIEVARRASARLLGVDFSHVALKQATVNATRLLPPGRFACQVATMDSAGLRAGAADGLMCVDAVQFAEPPLRALTEFRRVLAPGARLVLTCWEASDPLDERVAERIRAVNLERDLPAAGFTGIDVREKPEWRAAERRMWQEVVAARDNGDAAMRSLQAEGRRSLASLGSLRRVLAAATAPGGQRREAMTATGG